MSLINREALYEKACDLEAQALSYVGKIANDETKIEEWRIWSAILAERTAFKHDVFDAPTIEPERKMGKWSVEFSPAYKGGAYCECSQCNYKFAMGAYFEPDEWKFCPNCGADMGGEQDG